ncbi:MAG TPA: Gfo/Idh/MocA family oxidoreductase [Phycisphaerae bacterium]|nr:Gfo/Idh/MocA family oxidoreductase [Phycisphaerae bacterium]
MTKLLRAAVVGVGHMGRHHARIYSELPDVELVAVVDEDGDRAAQMAAQFGGEPLTDPTALIGKVDVVSVAVPTVYHHTVARPLIAAGIDLLIEKPLAIDTTTAHELLGWARAAGVVIAVGHSERFNPVVIAMKRMNVVPKFIETHRISPFTFRSADIGVVHDMMIHDIDIVLHLVKDRDYEVTASGFPVLGPHEDIANARVLFSNGCVANLTASRLALKTERKIRIFEPDAYLSMDYGRKTGIAITKDSNLDLLKLARERNFKDLSQLANFDFGSMVNIEPLEVDDTVEPLRAEIESFLAAARTNSEPAVTGEDGAAAVELAERIVASIASSSTYPKKA